MTSARSAANTLSSPCKRGSMDSRVRGNDGVDVAASATGARARAAAKPLSSPCKRGSMAPLGDQAGAAFGSAAVTRPAGSFLMPLRRTPHRPDLGQWLMRRAKRRGFEELQACWCTSAPTAGAPTPRQLQGPMACRGEVKEGARRAEGHERRYAVGPCSSPTKAPSPNAQITSVPVPANYPKPDPPRS